MYSRRPALGGQGVEVLRERDDTVLTTVGSPALADLICRLLREEGEARDITRQVLRGLIEEVTAGAVQTPPGSPVVRVDLPANVWSRLRAAVGQEP